MTPLIETPFHLVLRTETARGVVFTVFQAGRPDPLGRAATLGEAQQLIAGTKFTGNTWDKE